MITTTVIDNIRSQSILQEIPSHSFENLDKMDLFVARHNLTNYTWGEIDSFNRLISTKDTKSIINNFKKKKKKKAPGLDALTRDFYQTFKEEKYLFHNIFQKIEAE